MSSAMGLSILILAALPAPVLTPASHADLAAEFDRAVADFDEGQSLQTVDADRARQKFRSAAQRMSSVAAPGIVNGKLEFNIGNCFLQAGDLGQAILHYHRAERLIPRDPLLANNLAVARSRCLVQIAPSRRDEVLQSLLFWHYDTAESARVRAGLLLYAATLVLLSVRTLSPRRWLTTAAVACSLLTLTCGGSVAAGRWSERNAPSAVVTAMDVVVYKGPGPGYQRQFEQPLQPGVECVVREQRGGWWRIELADGKSGWIENTSLETVGQVSGGPVSLR